MLHPFNQAFPGRSLDLAGRGMENAVAFAHKEDGVCAFARVFELDLEVINPWDDSPGSRTPYRQIDQ